MGPGPQRGSRRRGALLALGLLAAAAAAGFGLWVLTLRGPPSADEALRASDDRQRDPVIVPRRRRPQVVEPVAGDVGSVAGVPEQPPAGAAGPERDPRAPRLEGAPSDAEVRRELGRLQAVSRQYRFDQLDFSSELLPFDALPSDGWRASVASVYYDYGGGLACGGVLRPEQLGVAHKTAPCGTRVTFRFGDRAIRVPVIDRGPYIRGREWDFTGATAAALGFPGLGAVEWHV